MIDVDIDVNFRVHTSRIVDFVYNQLLSMCHIQSAACLEPATATMCDVPLMRL